MLQFDWQKLLTQHNQEMVTRPFPFPRTGSKAIEQLLVDEGEGLEIEAI